MGSLGYVCRGEIVGADKAIRLQRCENLFAVGVIVWSIRHKQESLTIGRTFRLMERLSLDLSEDAINGFSLVRRSNPNTNRVSVAFTGDSHCPVPYNAD